jgi:hypothetical protein
MPVQKRNADLIRLLEAEFQHPISHAVCVEQVASGTAGGNFVAGAWRIRPLNTAICDTIPTDHPWPEIELPYYGIYEIHAWVPGYRCDHHMARLWDLTTGAAILYGTSAYSGSGGDYAQTCSYISGRVYAAPPVGLHFRIEHYCSMTRNVDGMGSPCTIAGVTERYAMIEIHRVSGHTHL